MTPQVAASERGRAQTAGVEARAGLKGRRRVDWGTVAEAAWKGPPERVRAPYAKPSTYPSRYLSRAGPEEPCPNPAAPSAKAKHSRETDRGQVP